MKILVTGFEPFGGEKINPSYEIVKKLKDQYDKCSVYKLEVPTAFNVSIKTVIEKIEEIKPDAVLMIGQAGGRFDISVERIGINVDDARIPDNIGQAPVDMPIDQKGLPAYFSTLPIKAIVRNIRQENIPASVSNTAGTYVCNHLMYGALNYIFKNNLPLKAGFIHIPYLMEQVTNRPNVPSMTLDAMIKAIETAIITISTTDQDIISQEGKES